MVGLNERIIVVVGMGYVGLANAVLLAQSNKVYVIDILQDKVNKLNNKESPIEDEEIRYYLKNKKLDITALTTGVEVYKKADYVIIATPTDYDPIINYFNTESIEFVIKQVLQYNRTATIVIKSTVPVGYTENLRKRLDFDGIFFSPEFLREGKALYDCLYPSRVIVGTRMDDVSLCMKAQEFSRIFIKETVNKDVSILITNSTEAEAIKLFANMYLAMRVSFFNELDTYAELMGLNVEQIIKGVSLDQRIGNFYNNPSFGYGGYCLPKDTQQLLVDFKSVPQSLMRAVIESNNLRKNHIVNQVLSKLEFSDRCDQGTVGVKLVGIYRLLMKKNSDNFRHSSVCSIMEKLIAKGVNVVIYEPKLGNLQEYFGVKVVTDIVEFKNQCSVILANRMFSELDDVKDKVYTRDLYGKD